VASRRIVKHQAGQNASGILNAEPRGIEPLQFTDTRRVKLMSRVKQSRSNALGDPSQSLQTFSLLDLQQFTLEKTYSTNASQDFHLFYVGRDDVHDILKYVLSRVSVSLYLNMFGYDDEELNSIVMAKALDPNITMLITLDKSQSGTKTEKTLLDADRAKNLAAFNTHFVVGESATHQISHTKGFVADGRAAAEGSTNWSTSGEGVFVITAQPEGKGYKAQNNTQSIITDPDTVQPLYRGTDRRAYGCAESSHAGPEQGIFSEASGQCTHTAEFLRPLCRIWMTQLEASACKLRCGLPGRLKGGVKMAPGDRGKTPRKPLLPPIAGQTKKVVLEVELNSGRLTHLYNCILTIRLFES
jgi:hypothetical protein